MAGVSQFTDLRIWQGARQWSKTIFWKTKETPFAEDRRLVVQINDSSESVMANIAEGFGRGTQGEFVQFLGYSIGSLNETQSMVKPKGGVKFMRQQKSWSDEVWETYERITGKERPELFRKKERFVD